MTSSQIFERHCAKAAIRPAATSAIHADINSIEADPIESAKSNLFDTSSWGEFCDVKLTGWVTAGPFEASVLELIAEAPHLETMVRLMLVTRAALRQRPF